MLDLQGDPIDYTKAIFTMKFFLYNDGESHLTHSALPDT